MSDIQKIHSEGMVAIIDGDSQRIIGKVKPEEVSIIIDELQTRWNDVSQDRDGDIIIYK